MKKDIHPTYFDKATIKCACGATFTVGSTVEKQEVEICSNCHPFYTGQEKIVDTAGRVEKFRARREAAKAQPKNAPKKVVKKTAEKETKKATKKPKAKKKDK